MAFRGRVEPVDRVGGDLHRRVEPERDVRPGEVVVDRLRDPDDRDPVGGELRAGAERALAADHDQAVEPTRVHRPSHTGGAVIERERIEPGASQDRAAAVEQPAGPFEREVVTPVLDDAAPAVAEPDHVVAERSDALADDRSDHGVQTRTVAAAGEQADPHDQPSLPEAPRRRWRS